jgi:PadR family transcriptional regulator, regulatory protein AphA
MSIKHALLGFLSWRPFTGYELKKMIAGSESLYWSGNNNQIYTTLVQIHQEGLVSDEVQAQEHGPSRKVYTITEKGRAELRAWVLTAPELPQLRNTFLIQLAWADQLQPAELDELLGKYEYEVEMRLLMCQEQERRGSLNPARTERETYLWNMVAQNYIGYYESELAWVRKLRQGVANWE